MNYRHIYHAGNFGDVFKHIVTTLLLAYMAQKAKPFSVLDSHAGIGLYDVTRDEAKRSPEFLQGIGLLLKQPLIPEIQAYVDIVKSFQPHASLTIYPGSPFIAQHFLRDQDELILNELHPDDFSTLKKNVQRYPNVHCHHRDAYEFLLALLPPQHKRGLIIIDPPYEKDSEYQQLTECISQCLKRFATGTYLIWYPIVSSQHEEWTKKILNLDVKLLHAYFTRSSISTDKQKLVGNGVIIINPPWQIDKKIETVTKYLFEVFRLNGKAQLGAYGVSHK